MKKTVIREDPVSPIVYDFSHKFERDNDGNLTGVLLLKIKVTCFDNVLYTLSFSLCDQNSFLKLKEKLDEIAVVVDAKIGLFFGGLRYKSRDCTFELWLNPNTLFAIQKAMSTALNEIKKEIDCLVCTKN